MKVSRTAMLLRWATLLVGLGLLAVACSCTKVQSPPPSLPPVVEPESGVTIEEPPLEQEVSGQEQREDEEVSETNISIEKINGQSAGEGKVPIVPVICEVAGTVALLPEDSQIWVVVRPVETSEYWAQPGPAQAEEDGHWVAYDCHFGAPGQHYGAEYDVWAVVTSESLPLGPLTDNRWRTDATAISLRVKARRAEQ